MRRRIALLAVIVAIAAPSVTPSPARAEWFADLYLGFAFTSDSDVEATPVTGAPRTFPDIEFNRSPLWGVRGGYWLADGQLLGGFGRYVGAALDVSYFKPRVDAQTRRTDRGVRRLGEIDLAAFAVTPEVLVRLPLMPTEDFPGGRLHPYGFIGPTIFIADADDPTGSFGRRRENSTDASLGFAVGPGIAFMLLENVAVFAEYRLMRASPTLEFQGGSLDFDVTSHHFSVGVSYRF